MYFLKINILFIIWALRCVANEDLMVEVEQGTLFGITKTNRITNESYYAFLGVPYARSPVRSDRFKVSIVIIILK